MSGSDDQLQVADENTAGEHFCEFWKIFFDPCQSRQRHVLGRNCVPVHRTSFFVEAARKLQLQRTASGAVDESQLVYNAAASYLDEGISEGSEVRSVEGSEQSLFDPGIVAKMDRTFLVRQCTEPSNSHRASFGSHLRRTSSYEERSMRMQVQETKHLSDSAAMRRASSAYGSQDQSLLISNQNEEVELSSGITTPDNSNGSTIVYEAGNVEPPQLSNSSLIFFSAEFSTTRTTANIPSVVADWQLTDDNEFESATSGLRQDQFPSVANWETLKQSLSYQQIYEAICELEQRVIRGLLVQLLWANNSPELVQSVAQELIMPAADAEAEAVGNSL